MEQIFPKIFKIVEPKCMNNVYYIDDSKKVQIDASVVFDKPVDILVLTHCHFDHIHKAAEIKRKNPNCTIAASEEAAAHIKNMDEVVIEPVEKFRVDMVLSEGAQLFTGEYRFKVIKVPGHSSGDIAVYESSKGILFSGDCWFGGDDTGRWDCPTGNLRELKASVERLKGLKVNLLCTGHSY